MNTRKNKLSSLAWDLFCITSIIGIWPRFIEPRILRVTKANVYMKNIHPDLIGLKILHFSDVHLHSGVSPAYLNRFIAKAKKLKPDIILFTGDVICKSKLDCPQQLISFFSSLKAPYGCYGIFGNHDYSQYVSLSVEGVYDISSDTDHYLQKVYRRFFCQKTHHFQIADRVKEINFHTELQSALEKTGFRFLHNESVQVAIGRSKINICGLGDVWLRRCLPEVAFHNYNSSFPGIVLSHNPDTIPSLISFPGDLILCGHTHGGQVNLPFIWNKFSLMENPQLKRGLLKMRDKTIYVNRGIGTVEPFRWFSFPEITLLTIERT